MYAAKDEWIDEPLIHTLTVYSGYNAHRIKAAGCKVYSVKKALLNMGRIMVLDNCGNEIPMYDLERTVCDIARSRNSIEVQDFGFCSEIARFKKRQGPESIDEKH